MESDLVVFPLIPLLIGSAIAGTIVNTASSLYQQNNYRSLTNIQNKDYEQMYSDFKKNTGRDIKYRNVRGPTANLLSNQYGIANSYAQSFTTAYNGASNLYRNGGLAAYSQKKYWSAYAHNNRSNETIKRWL